MDKRRLLLAIALLGIVLGSSVVGYYYRSSSSKYVYLSTTTSFDATGFLYFLKDYLYDKYGLDLGRTAVGTGMALRIADRGDSDGCIVHAPKYEYLYRKNGTFETRKVIAYNFFVIVGPSNDPAGVSRANDTVEAFYKILLYGESHPNEKVFVSRYDESGTHVKEKSIRELVISRYHLNVTYSEISSRPRYVRASAGMSETLMMAQEFSAYTLSDIATYLVMKKNAGLRLDKLRAGDYYTLNVYSIMVVKNAKHEREAIRLADFLASDEGQNLFSGYGTEEYGYPLFFPARPLLSAYKSGSLQPGTEEYVPPDLKGKVDDLTLARRIFEYAFRDVNGDNIPDRESGR